MSNVRGWSSLLFVALVAASSCTSHASALDAPQERAHINGVRERFPAFGDLLRGAARAPAIPTPDGFAIAPRDDGAKSRGAWRNAVRPLRASLGARADEPLRLDADGAPAIAVLRVHAAGSAGRLDGGAVVYDEAFAGVDAVVFATDAGVEELLVVNDPDAAIAYTVDVPQGFRLVGAVGGIAELRDAGGAARLRMRAGAAWDAAGRRVPIGVRVEGDQIRVTIEGGFEPPVAIDPEWSQSGVLTVPRAYHTSTLLSDGRVLIACGDGLGTAEIHDPRKGTFTTTGSLAINRYAATATLLFDGTVLIACGADFPTSVGIDFPYVSLDQTFCKGEIYDPDKETFAPVSGQDTGTQIEARTGHTATLLPTGQVLIAGGWKSATAITEKAHLYDPVTQSFGPAISMVTPRAQHAAMALENGRVLLVGGKGSEQTAEIFEPVTKSFSVTGSLHHARKDVAVARLPSGKVLVTGRDSSTPLPAELYDPTTGTWATVGAPLPRIGASATLLPSGLVLLAGSTKSSPSIDSPFVAEIFDPATNTFSPTSPLAFGRGYHQATLLPSGRVLVTGGLGIGDAALSSTEVYDPLQHRIWSPTLIEPRGGHTATELASGQVLFAGGFGKGWFFNTSTDAFASAAEIYDPISQLVGSAGPMVHRRTQHTATRLPNGKVLIAGGIDAVTQHQMAQAEIFDPETGTFSSTGSMTTERRGHTAVLLPPPHDKVLIVGGWPNPALTTAELYDPATGTFSPTGSMAAPHFDHTATLLPSGKVVVAGGWESAVEIYDPLMGTFTPAPGVIDRRDLTATLLTTGDILFAGGVGFSAEALLTAEVFNTQTGTVGPAIPLTEARSYHAAALLPDGRALISGAYPSITTAELFDPQTSAFAAAGAEMSRPRVAHTATPLSAAGKISIAGGLHGVSPSFFIGVPEIERYDPATDTFEMTSAGPPRHHATLTRLSSGKVLLAGGRGADGEFMGLALYDPATGAFTDETPPAVPRLHHTATTLGSGKVLVAGGCSPDYGTATTELFDPQATPATSAGQSMSAPRCDHTATLLPSGKVLISGGADMDALGSAEIYDPATDTFTPTKGPMSSPRFAHAAVLLSSGKVLIAGGRDLGGSVGTAEIYDPVTDMFTPTPEPPPGALGRTSATALGSGAALLVGESMALRYAVSSGAFEALGNAPSNAFAAVPLPSGDVFVCGIGRCAVFDVVAKAFIHEMPNGVDAEGGSATTLATGDVLVVSGHHETGFTFRYEELPRDVVRPVISSAPAQLQAGSTVTVQGQRFTRLSARGSALAQPTTGTAPLAYVAPASAGVPLFGAVTDWADDHLTFRVPQTIYNGPAWLHVVVDGVPSLARRVVLVPASGGAACSLDGECASGFCTEGVCCDLRCDEACHSCLGEPQGPGGQDGKCGPIPAGVADAKGSCPKDEPHTCGYTGVCDGNGHCASEPDGTRCGTAGGRCSGGTCTLSVECQSNLDCIPQFVCGADRRCQPIIAPPAEEESSCATRPRGGPSPAPWGAAGILVIAALLRRIATKARRGA